MEMNASNTEIWANLADSLCAHWTSQETASKIIVRAFLLLNRDLMFEPRDLENNWAIGEPL